MLEHAWLGLTYLASAQAAGLLLLGVLIGLMIGVLPGLGGLVALALLLPLAYSMEAVPALTLILAATSAIYFGGSITAILMNTPGTGEQVVTTFDGYPMARQGKGARALGISATSSALGGLIGVAVLVILIPLFRNIIVYFGPPEMFAMGLVGVTFIGILDAGSITKGILSGMFGLLLSFVGMDMITGTARFTFGSAYLYDGISINSLTLGLFAIAEMFSLHVRGKSIADIGEGDVRLSREPGYSVWDGVKDTLRHWKLVLLGGGIGALIGVLPGLGATAAMFFAYAQAMRLSKHPEKFGTGIPEGIIAPESANNAKEGGSLVPTVTLGIPGSSGMAIFMGIFLILGLQPGPQMVRDHLDLIFLMAWVVAIASVVASVMGLGIAPLLARITHLRPQLIVPTLISVSFIGSFIDSQLMTGVLVVVVAGFVGYLFKVLNYSSAGVTLGFVLGPIIERNMYISLQAYGASFLQRPITLGVLIAGVLMIVAPYLRRRRSTAPAMTGGYPA